MDADFDFRSFHFSIVYESINEEDSIVFGISGNKISLCLFALLSKRVQEV